jgi:pimeloyl-ACP methyl ester carboxylesterase
VTGVGPTATVFAHGLAGDVASTRPLGSAVAGRRVFFHFRGHGRSDRPPGPWTYADLARDLSAVAEESHATRAVGVSLGASALCRLLASSHDRFDRVVLYLPAPLDEARAPIVRERFARLLAAVGAGDAAATAEALAADLPYAVRNTSAGWTYLRQRVEQLLRDGLAPQLLTVADEPALADLAALSEVRAPALVIGCAGDDAHPVPAAERLAAALPAAELCVYDRPGVLWNRRRDLRERISGFLNRP